MTTMRRSYVVPEARMFLIASEERVAEGCPEYNLYTQYGGPTQCNEIHTSALGDSCITSTQNMS